MVQVLKIDKDKEVGINFTIPKDLHKRFKAICILEEEQMYNKIIDLIRKYVKNKEE